MSLLVSSSIGRSLRVARRHPNNAFEADEVRADKRRRRGLRSSTQRQPELDRASGPWVHCSYLVTMKARLIRIGNSRGVRLPKPLIEEAGLEQDVELRVREGAVVITSSRSVRAGWAEAACRLRERGGDRLLDQPSATRFDLEEWRWR